MTDATQVIVQEDSDILLERGSDSVISIDSPDSHMVAVDAEDVVVAVTVVEKTYVADGAQGVQGIPGVDGNDGATGPQGVQGIPGIGSEASIVAKPAGETIAKYRVLLLLSGVAYLANPSNTAHSHDVYGVALTDSTYGDSVDIRVAGEIVNPLWSWNVNLPIFLGSGGILTQSVPAAPGFSMIVGFAATTQSMIVRLREPIILEV